MSFFVALPSHANRREFPQNQANSFKIHLPYPLHLPGGQWQVGLSAISLPDTQVNMYELVKKGDHVMGIKWIQTIPTPVSHDSHESALAQIDDLKDLDWIVNGVGFMKAAINHAEQPRQAKAVLGAKESTHVCQVSMGRGRPTDLQHQCLSLWIRHHSQRRF